MYMPSIKLPHAKFNANLTLQLCAPALQHDDDSDSKGKNALRTVYLLLQFCPTKPEQHAKIRSIF